MSCNTHPAPSRRLSTIRRRAAAACLLSAAILGAHPAHAENAAAEEAGDGGRTIIVIGEGAAAQAEQQKNATPGGADVVTYDEYADKSLTSLRDALAFSPGVYLQPRYGQEVRISIRGSGISRGFHMRGLTLLQDGIPINLADDNGDFQELEPIFFDHLEVYRGANALRFGSGTLGGAVNGVTPTGRDARGIYVRADAGSFDTYRGLLTAGGVSGAGDFWAAFSADSSDGDRDHAKRHSLRFHGNVGLEVTDAIKTRFYASVNNIDQQLPGALPLETVLTDPSTGNFTGNQQRDIDSIRLQNRTDFRIGDAEVAAGVFVNAKSLFHPIYQVVDQQSVDRGGFVRMNWSRGPVEVSIGGEARFGNVTSRRYVNVDGERGALTFDADQEARTANIYGEVRFRPVESLTLIAGGIYADGMRRQHENYNITAGGFRDVRAEADFREFSPRFGVLFAPNEDIQVYANYSRSAEFPGFIELAQISQFVPVDAQTAWTAEIGTRGQAGMFGWDVSLYRANITGEMLQFSIGPDIPASTFNADKTRHEGIEAAFTLDPTEWIRLRQTYQFSNFHFRNDALYGDNTLPVVPRHVLRTEIRLGTDALHVAPNLEWVPQGAWADYHNTTRVEGYALIGMTAGARITENVDLFLDARNLTNKKAVGDISAVVTATPTSVIYYPVERRAIFGGVRARF